MNKILAYHSIENKDTIEAGASLYCLSAEQFSKQMAYVNKLRDTTTVTITFDDGDITNYIYAYPILKKLGLRAYFFIIAGRIGTSGYMNAGQIEELVNGGMIIGSHGMSHRILTELNNEELDYELIESKEILEKELEQPINYLSIPRGFYNNTVIKKIREAGYKAVFTSNPKDNDGFKLGRIAVKGNWDLNYFVRVINKGLSFKDETKEWVKDSLKKTLGSHRYDRIRTKILSKK